MNSYTIIIRFLCDSYVIDVKARKYAKYLTVAKKNAIEVVCSPIATCKESHSLANLDRLELVAVGFVNPFNGLFRSNRQRTQCVQHKRIFSIPYCASTIL